MEEKEAERGVGTESPFRGYSQGTHVWRCRAPQSKHGWQWKGEPPMHCVTKHSMNQPGLQPQRVSAIAEQFSRATWEAGGGCRDMGRAEAIRSRDPYGEVGQTPPRPAPKERRRAARMR